MHTQCCFAGTERKTQCSFNFAAVANYDNIKVIENSERGTSKHCIKLDRFCRFYKQTKQ